MAKGKRRIRATLGVQRCDAVDVLACGEGVHAGFTANAAVFANPPVSLVTLGSQIADLHAAQKNARTTRTHGTVAVRDLARDVLWTSLEACRTFVQGIVDANPEQGYMLIDKAGMKVASSNVASKRMLDARLDPQGTVVLRAHAQLLHKGTTSRCFNWQYTIDGGKTWIAVASTPVATTSIAGLPALTTCGFRVSVTHKKGQTEWSQPVSLLVHQQQ